MNDQAFLAVLADEVTSAGGYGHVGLELWPEKSLAEAGDSLRHCLNPLRREKLGISDLARLFSILRLSGRTASWTMFAASTGGNASDLRVESARLQGLLDAATQCEKTATILRSLISALKP